MVQRLYHSGRAEIDNDIHTRGYVVEESDLEKIEAEVAKYSWMSKLVAGNSSPEFEYSVFLKNGTTSRYHGAREIAGSARLADSEIERLRLRVFGEGDNAAALDFKDDGRIAISVSGPEDSADELAHALQRNVATMDQEFARIARIILHSEHVKGFLSFVLFSSFVLVILVLLIGLVFQSGRLNVELPLYSSRSEYYSKINDALSSQDTNKKLDAILMFQFKDLTNDGKSALSLMQAILFCVALSLVSFFGLKLIKFFHKLYPQSFFAIGPHAKALSRIKSRRDFWVITIFVGFFVNVAAGLLFLFL